MASTVRRPRDRRPSAHVTRVGEYLAVHYPTHTPAGWDQQLRGRDAVPVRFVRAAHRTLRMSIANHLENA